MAGAKTANNKATSTQRHRYLNGELVTSVLYNGQAVGHGKYFAGSVKGQLVCDENGKPIPYKEIGELK